MAPQMKKLSTTEAGAFFRENRKSPAPNGAPLHPIVQPFQDRARMWQNGQESWIEAAIRELSDLHKKIDGHELLQREYVDIIEQHKLEVAQLKAQPNRDDDLKAALGAISTLTDDIQSLTTENDAWIAHIQEQDAKLESLGQSIEVRDREIVSLGQEIARLNEQLAQWQMRPAEPAEEPKPEVAASKSPAKVDPEIPVKSRWIDKKYGSQVVVARSTGAGKVVFYKDGRFHTLVRDAFLLQYDPIGG